MSEAINRRCQKLEKHEMHEKLERIRFPTSLSIQDATFAIRSVSSWRGCGCHKRDWNAHWESTRQPKHAYFGIMGSRRQVQSSHLEELKTSPIDL